MDYIVNLFWIKNEIFFEIGLNSNLKLEYFFELDLKCAQIARRSF
jgi:hypothetical protein